MLTCQRLTLSAALALGLTAPVLAATLGAGWRYRRPLEVRFAGLPPPGGRIAWAQFYTNHARRPHGSDLRVTAADGTLMPIRLMRVRPGDDLVRLAFAAPTAGTYDVWWGNPHPGAAPPRLPITRGVWLRVFPYTRGRCFTGRQMRRVFRRTQPVESFFVPNIFIGYDPRGWKQRDAFLYRGLLHITVPGTYVFAFDVRNQGFVDLDRRPLLVKTQPSGMWGRVRFQRRVVLKAGWHRLRAGAIELWAPAGIALDWRPPGQRRFSPVPPQAFAAVAPARVGRLRRIGGGYAADFTVRPQAQIFTPPSYYLQRYAFDALVPASFDPRVQWSFSDGQTATGLRCQHIFLAPGVYTVRVTVQQAGNTFTAARRLRVHSELVAQFPYPAADPAVVVAKLLNTYHLSRLTGAELYRGVQFFRRYNAYRGLTRWAKAWAASPDPQPQRQVLAEAGALVRRALARKHYRQAANLYLLVAHKPMATVAQANLLAHYAMLASDYTSSAAWASATLTGWSRQHPHARAAVRHILNTALAYAAIAQGHGAVAAAWVKKAAREGAQPPPTYRDREIRQGVLARNVESYIDSGNFRTADRLLYQWDMEFPSAILRGYTRLLRVKLLGREHRPLIAAHIAEQYVSAEPHSFYAAKLLEKAYQALLAGGKRTEALLVHAKLTQDYPESPYAK